MINFQHIEFFITVTIRVIYNVPKGYANARITLSLDFIEGYIFKLLFKKLFIMMNYKVNT